MNFSNYLSQNLPAVEDQVTALLIKWQQETSGDSPLLNELTQELVTSSAGGKRLRAILIKLGYEIFGGRSNREIIRIGAAFEIFQTAILIHDDIIDQSPTRRGRPTVYRALGGDHYAVSQAICIGDSGLFLAIRTILQTNFSPAIISRAAALFCQIMLDTTTGQMLDVLLPNDRKTQTVKNVLDIFRLKTARYTVTGPLQLGAVLAGADNQTLTLLQNFGDNLGIAFQIQDDILGVFGSEEITGKSTQSDIEEGKITLLYLYALEHTTPSDKQFLLSHYGQRNINKSQVEHIRKIIMESGSLEHSRQQASTYANRATALIPQLTSDPHFQQLLTEMADLLINRQK